MVLESRLVCEEDDYSAVVRHSQVIYIDCRVRGIGVVGCGRVKIPGAERLSKAGLPLQHATLQALLVLDLEQADDSLQRHRAEPTRTVLLDLVA